MLVPGLPVSGMPGWAWSCVSTWLCILLMDWSLALVVVVGVGLIGCLQRDRQPHQPLNARYRGGRAVDKSAAVIGTAQRRD